MSQAQAQIQDKLQATLDVVTAFAVRAHTRATADTHTVELAKQPIRLWRRLAGLDDSANTVKSANNRRTVVLEPEFVPSH
jgi:hypothetical protein